jgi:uncharacterized OsmC-like protein
MIHGVQRSATVRRRAREAAGLLAGVPRSFGPLFIPSASCEQDMPDANATRATLERVITAVSLRPSVGQGTAVTKVNLRPNLVADVEDGPWQFSVGMSEKYGGDNSAPNPGVYGRAAFGSCLAISYSMWAARLGIPIDALSIEVQADYDIRGELGVEDSVSPGYTEMRYVVSVESTASESDIMRLLDTADRYSSWRDDIARAVPVRREVRLSAPSR